jgi:hypothetical protein
MRNEKLNPIAFGQVLPNVLKLPFKPNGANGNSSRSPLSKPSTCDNLIYMMAYQIGHLKVYHITIDGLASYRIGNQPLALA